MRFFSREHVIQEIFVFPQLNFDRLARLAVMSIGLSSAASSTVFAQTTLSPDPARAAPVQVAPAPFQSTLEGYKPYTEEKMVNWRLANDTTARIGGWRAYAKEAASAESGPDTGLTTSPGKP